MLLAGCAAAAAYLFGTSSFVFQITFILLALFPAFIVATACHEAGHLLGAMLAGFRFLSYAVGPVWITATRGGIRFRWDRHWALMEYGGLAASAPRDASVTGPALRRKLAMVLAGGPAASLLFWVLLNAMHEMIRGRGFLLSADLVMLTALVSLATGLINAVPFVWRGWKTDGARLLMLLRGGGAAERWCANTVLDSLARAGQRPRDWPDRWIERAISPLDGSLDDAAGCLMAYAAYLDRGEVERAGSFLSRAFAMKEKLPSLMRTGILLELAFFEARHRANSEARKWLDQAGESMLFEAARLRSEAAVLLLEGNPQEARQKAEKALRLLEDAPFLGANRGLLEAERDSLNDLVRLAQPAKVGSASDGTTP